MEIKFHSMEEVPVRSCDVVMLNRWLELRIVPYSKKHHSFNTRDTDSEENAKSLAVDENYYLGWVYADQLVWQMEAAYEAQ